jgi:hypothetical protein
VTFFIVDPLFSFDLSNPRNIVQLDELKIPGFSRYMHRWADGLLLGIGVDAEEEFGMRTGLKISMFDTRDNENLFERHVYIITDEHVNDANQDWWSDDWAWSWFSSPAEWEHKSILICPEKNIIAFPYSYSFSSRNHWHNEYKYAIFSYDPHFGFTLIGEIDYNFNPDSWWWGNGFSRGLYIGDYLYVIAEDRIVSAELQTARIIQELRFFDYEEWYREMYGDWYDWDYDYWDEPWEEDWDYDRDYNSFTAISGGNPVIGEEFLVDIIVTNGGTLAAAINVETTGGITLSNVIANRTVLMAVDDFGKVGMVSLGVSEGDLLVTLVFTALEAGRFTITLNGDEDFWGTTWSVPGTVLTDSDEVITEPDDGVVQAVPPIARIR